MDLDVSLLLQQCNFCFTEDFSFIEMPGKSSSQKLSKKKAAQQHPAQQPPQLVHEVPDDLPGSSAVASNQPESQDMFLDEFHPEDQGLSQNTLGDNRSFLQSSRAGLIPPEFQKRSKYELCFEQYW